MKYSIKTFVQHARAPATEECYNSAILSSCARRDKFTSP